VKTVEQVLALTTAYLEQQGLDRARFHAEEVLAEGLGLRRMDLYMDFQRPLQNQELQQCRDVLARRAKREPIQYIRGTVEFLGCHLKVDGRALIPRQETEILLSQVFEEWAVREDESVRVLDLCCGSGCIAVALKKRFPRWTVVAADLSEEALALARENAEREAVEIDFVQGDLLQSVGNRSFELVLCNPPYISDVEMLGLEPEVKEYEPELALSGGVDGLDIYRRLAEDLPGVLVSGAKVYFEMGSKQGPALMEIFGGDCWKGLECRQDWAGHDRFFSLEFL
jgi:release factor glutamine methyltransferase